MRFNLTKILHVLGVSLFMLTIAMASSIAVSLLYKEFNIALALAKTLLIAGLIAAVLMSINKSKARFQPKDAILAVSLIWICSIGLSSLPYIFSGTLGYIDAIFEATSGITTTASTVINDIDGFPKGLLFWRATTQWIGGLWILIFAVSLFSDLSIGTVPFNRGEITTISNDKLTTRLSKDAKLLIFTYFMLTAVTGFFLLLGNMSLFDAVCHALSTVSAGGFSTHTTNIAYFNSIYIDFIITLFSYLSTINLFNYIYISRRHRLKIVKDSEVKLYSLILILFSIVISLNLLITSSGAVVPAAVFAVVSFASTSGFYFFDMSLLPTLSKFLLFMLLFIGGCSVSSSGSIKNIRVLIIIKSVLRNLEMLIHPSAIIPLKLRKRAVTPEAIGSAISFIWLYLLVFLVGGFLMAFDTSDITTALMVSAASLSNTGIGAFEGNYSTNYSIFTSFSKVSLSLIMLIGRLDIFTILLLFTPGFWRAKQ